MVTKNRDAIDWPTVERVLVVKLRSIGDTVLATPSLIALRRFLPNVQIDILLEDWVAPVLDGFNAVDNVITIGKSTSDRLRIARELRGRRYDVAFNLHGGTTATMLVRASGARHRVGLATYQYPFLYNHVLESPATFWGREAMHSAEQQLALLGSVGVPVEDRPKSALTVTEHAARSIADRLERSAIDISIAKLAMVHPGTAFFTKQWPVENFARVAEYLQNAGIGTVAVGSPAEADVLKQLKSLCQVPIITFDDLMLPEITALAARARVFVGNDSGIAHIAAAVNTPSVVIFGSSSRDHWRPWTNALNEVVYEEFACQPCAGYVCKEFGEPRCILGVKPKNVIDAIERILAVTD